MPGIERSALVPYTASEMYALVNDVAAYPQFLPWCVDAQVHEREDDAVVATLTLAKGRVRQSFTTRNTMQPDSSIRVELVEGPFRRLQGCWHFTPRGETGCEVRLELEFEFANRLLQMTFGKVFSRIADSMVEAFCRRAVTVYGTR